MTLAEPARELDLDRFLPYLVNVLASRISADLATVYGRRFGISIAEWRVIAHLAQNRKVSVREIFARVDMNKAKVSRAAARLESAGIIEKKTHAADRRLVELSLTRKGRRLFQEIVPLALDYEARLLRQLDAKDAARFRRIVTTLLARSAADGQRQRREAQDRGSGISL